MNLGIQQMTELLYSKSRTLILSPVYKDVKTEREMLNYNRNYILCKMKKQGEENGRITISS